MNEEVTTIAAITLAGVCLLAVIIIAWCLYCACTVQTEDHNSVVKQLTSLRTCAENRTEWGDLVVKQLDSNTENISEITTRLETICGETQIVIQGPETKTDKSRDSSCQTERKEVHFEDPDEDLPLVERYIPTPTPSAPDSELIQVENHPDLKEIESELVRRSLTDIRAHTPPPTSRIQYEETELEDITVVVETEEAERKPLIEEKRKALTEKKRKALIEEEAGDNTASFNINQITHLEACSEVLIDKVSRIERKLRQNNIK